MEKTRREEEDGEGLDGESSIPDGLEAPLSVALEEYADAAQDNARLLADLSRNIRDGLNTIIGYSDLVLDDDAQEGSRDELDRIRRSAWTLLDSVEQLEMVVARERRQRRIAEGLRAVVAMAAEADDLADFAPGMLDRLGEFLDFDLAQLWINERGTLVLAAQRCREELEPCITAPRRRIEEARSHPVISALYEERNVIAGDSDVFSTFGEPPLERWLLVPLSTTGVEPLLGVLTLGRREASDLTEPSPGLIERVAEHVGAAVAQTKRLDRMHQRATIDSLTGIANRRHFFELTEPIVARASEEERPLTLFVLDIDHFKHLNDRHGHPEGDRVLEQVAQTLRRSLRDADVLGRYGGEEFIIAVPDTPLEPHGRRVADRLRAVIDELEVVSESGEPMSCTISVGATELEHDTDDLNDLIKRADHALYEAKANGRNRVALA